MRFVFVTGGVISSLGKGLTAASLGSLLKASGLRVGIRKFDPYLNVDPGTLSPYEHGEVYVMDDGTEADLDCGHYERFLGHRTSKIDCTTTGQVYQSVLEAERRGEYLGKTVMVVPHITQAIQRRIEENPDNQDVMVCEIGGTVGDIESLPFLEAVRQLRHHKPQAVCVIHVAWIPFVKTAGEYKTKPVQHSVKELQRAGIQPDLLLLRCDARLPKEILDKVGLFCNVPRGRVISGLTQKNIYAVPLAYHAEGLDQGVKEVLRLPAIKPDLSPWELYQQKRQSAKAEIVVGVVGKYGTFPDAYRSLYEALEHSGVWENVRVRIVWIDPEEVEKKDLFSESADLSHLLNVDAVLVPGGFGMRGIEGKIQMIRWARQQDIPFFGICLGMQLAVIEAVRSVDGYLKASSSEFDPGTPYPVVHALQTWERDGRLHTYEGDSRGLGGTMRLGLYPCVLKQNTKAFEIYGCQRTQERHRHRFEVNLDYAAVFKEAGLTFSGLSPCGKLPEIVERQDHSFFIGVQFHPEYLSSPHQGHPLFRFFLKAALDRKRLLSAA